ncbi:MAG: hypothetical protein ACR2PA_09725 [Hyphomicrobiaceae bacterium]
MKEFTLDGGRVVQPFIKAGVSFYNEDNHGLTAEFAGATAGASTFTMNSDFGNVFGDIEAGLNIFDNSSSFSLNLSYEGRFSLETQQHGVAAKGRLKF